MTPSDEGDHVNHVMEPMGLLIVRIWREGPPTDEIRARIIRVIGVSRKDRLVTVVQSAPSIEAVVHEWLQDFLAASRADRPSPD